MKAWTKCAVTIVALTASATILPSPWSGPLEVKRGYAQIGTGDPNQLRCCQFPKSCTNAAKNSCENYRASPRAVPVKGEWRPAGYQCKGKACIKK